jgi:hypothetical protein
LYLIKSTFCLLLGLLLLTAGNGVLAEPEHLVIRGWPSGTPLEFINYALDPDHGQFTVRESGFIPAHLRSSGEAR